MTDYSAIKKLNLSICTTWMDREDIMLSEISQTEKDEIPHDLTYMWSLKNKTNK